MEETNLPKIIRAQKQHKDKIKGVKTWLLI